MEIRSDSQEQLRADLQRAIADQYTIEREVGRGGMATVFLAHEHHPSRRVAIKVLDPDVTTRLTRRRFLREVEVVSNLSHPHIVPIFAAGDKDGLLYYVMPYIEGETLRQKLSREGVLPLDEALHIARDVAGALHHAHEQFIAHRDIKPENILLSDGHPVVADFGVARAITCAECGDEVQPLTKAGLPIGTPLYMSPEQAEGRSDLDGRADIYSLACVVYEMLTGEAPYTGNTMYEIMTRHTQDKIPALKTPPGSPAPRSVRRAIAKAMSKSPDDRYATAREFADALSAQNGSSEFTAIAESKGGRGLAALVVFALLVIAGGFGLGRLGAGESSPIYMVAPFENQTGDGTLDSLGFLASRRIAASLEGIAGLSIVQRDVAGDPSTAATQGGAGAYVWGTFYLQGTSLSLQPRVVDPETGTLLALPDPIAGDLSEAVALIDSAAVVIRSTIEQITTAR